MSEQTPGGDPAGREWMKDAEEAMDRAGESLRAAWEATRENRMSALEAAKQAARQLGEAIDQGIVTARERWGATPSATAPDEEE